MSRLTGLAVTPAFYALLVLTTWVYSPGLSGGFILDDYANLEPLTLWEAGKLAPAELIWSGAAGPLKRPVATLSLWGDWQAGGGLPETFKRTNLALHLVCGALVFWLAGRSLAAIRPQAASNLVWWTALGVAALWLLAPLFASTVLYVVQRMAQLAALFTLAGLLTYVMARQLLLRGRWTCALPLLALTFLVFLPLAAFSKENGALLPLLALVMEVFIFRFRGTRAARRLLAGVFAVFLLLPAVGGLLYLLLDPDYFARGYGQKDFTLLERLYTQARVLVDYLSQLVFPRGASMGLYQDDLQISRGILSPVSTLAAVGFWMGVLISALYLRSPPLRAVAFGLGFFLAGHALESTIFPLELYFEHRNYLPAVGLFLGGGAAALWLAEQHPSRRHLMAVVAGLLVVVYGAATYQRAQVWSSWPAVLMTSLQAHPESPRLRSHLADLYAKVGRIDDALSELRYAEALVVPERHGTGPLLQQFVVHCGSDRPVPARLYTRLSAAGGLDNDPHTESLLKALRAHAEEDSCPQIDNVRLVGILLPLLEASGPHLNPNRRWSMMMNLAGLASRVGRAQAALDLLVGATTVRPERPEPFLSLLRYQLDMKDWAGAVETLSRMRGGRVELNQAHRRELATLQARLGETEPRR